jgi:YHS domain-containing protein
MSSNRIAFRGANLKHAVKVLAVVAMAAGGIAPLTGHAVKQTGGEYNTMYAGLGAKGYDVVAYFDQGKPVQGSASYESFYGGVTWRFASKKHRDMFDANPEKYAPQYGGFCSWGAAHGKLFDVDPVNGWTFVDGKLYLNFNADLNKTFTQEAAKMIPDADKHWESLNR